MTVTTNTARPTRWLDRAFQIRLPFFMLLVAGSAVAFWGWRFRDRNVDPQGSFLSHQVGELSRGDALSRLTAAESLGGAWAEHLPMALPALLNAARDADPRVRGAVIVSLGTAISGAAWAREGRIGPEIDAATPTLVASLADRDATVRQEAARALTLLKGEFVKPPSQPARPPSAAATGEEKVKLVNGAPAPPVPPTPVPYGPDPSRVVPALEVAARDPDSRVRIAAIDALGRIAPKDKDFPPILLQVFRHEPEPGVRRKATIALCQPWKNADVLWTPLLDRLGGEDSDDYGSVANSLRKLGTPPASAMPALLRALASNNEGADYALSQALGLLGPPARAALPGLLEIARRETPDKSGKFLAAEAIAMIDPNSPEARAVPPIVVARIRSLGMNSRWPHYYPIASPLFAKLGPSASGAVPSLLDALKEEEKLSMREQIALLLASITPGAKAALPELAKIARLELTADTPNRFIATQAIVSIDPASSEALSLLIPLARVMINARDDWERDQAVMKISDMAHLAGPALPEIRRAMDDPDPDRRRVARALMEKIEYKLQLLGKPLPAP